MKLLTAICLTASCIVTTTTSAQQYKHQSAPFYLTLSTTNGSYSGTILGTCKLSGGILGLCADGTFPNATTAGNTFAYNSTDGNINNAQQTGFLTFTEVADTGNVSKPLQLIYDPISNVAFANLITASKGLFVQFFNGQLEIPAIYDDTFRTSDEYMHVSRYFRWLICTTTYNGGNRATLNWQLGAPKAENPTCQTVSVRAQFV